MTHRVRPEAAVLKVEDPIVRVRGAAIGGVIEADEALLAFKLQANLERVGGVAPLRGGARVDQEDGDGARAVRDRLDRSLEEQPVRARDVDALLERGLVDLQLEGDGSPRSPKGRPSKPKSAELPFGGGSKSRS